MLQGGMFSQQAISLVHPLGLTNAVRYTTNSGNLTHGGPPLFLELFAGRGSFSRAMIQSGFEVISVDHKVGHPFAPIVSLDLTTDTGRQILSRLLQHPRLFAIHMGLPCGTASRAREKPIPQELQEQGVPSPPQLRSAENPLGMPGFEPKESG